MEHRRPRWLWPTLALPGTAWLVVLFAVPFYGVLSIAGGFDDPLFGARQPQWNPLKWSGASFGEVWRGLESGVFGQPFVRTCTYVVLAMLMCFIIGFPVAYYVARFAGKRRGLMLALLLAPFWISYLMRMLAWVNLLQEDGYVNDVLGALHVSSGPINWLDARWYTIVFGLVYGYVPFFILPLFASLDRIDIRLLEASKDLGVGTVRTLIHVTLPSARQGILAATAITVLPMFGDYYTNQLLSSSPRTNMIGNQIQAAVQSPTSRGVGAALVLSLTLFLTILMGYYLYASNAATKDVR